MKLSRVALRSLTDGFYNFRFSRSMTAWSTATKSDDVGFGNNDNQNTNAVESADDFKGGGIFEKQTDILFQTFDRYEKTRYGSGMGFTASGNSSGMFDGENDSITSLKDGMDGKLKEAAAYFEVDPQEIAADGYNFRHDINFRPKMTYIPEDLNLRKQGFYKPLKRSEFKVNSKEALEKADFRNVRFLAKFITEAGLLVKRSKTGISAKAQRKVAREIKTARAFGLLPFTTMGTKSFRFGKTMENLDQDYEVDPYDNPTEINFVEDPVE